jgi:DNA-binding transcriptional LysR family regulator
LASVDLNLLVAFEAMLVERNVSRAAQRVGLAQPSMSHVLSRLRLLFNDELFVRTPQEMKPTPRALELATPIIEALEQVRRALEPHPAFDPATSERRFRLAGNQYVDFAAMLALLPILMRTAPYACFEALKEGTDIIEMLDTGAADLGVGYFPDAPKRLRTAPLYDDSCVCVARRDHPGLRDGLTLERFCELPHILIGHDADPVHIVDAALRAEGRRRRISHVLYSYPAVPYMLEITDLLAVVGRRAAERFAASGVLSLYELPIAVPSWKVSMLWSRRTDADPELVWLRQVLHDAMAPLRSAV